MDRALFRGSEVKLLIELAEADIMEAERRVAHFKQLLERAEREEQQSRVALERIKKGGL